MIIPHHLPHGGDKSNSPKRIVVHSMAEYIMDPHPIHAPEFLDGYGYSAHALVAPNGDIYLCRDDDERAWHARDYNRDSLGIEILVPGEHNYASFVETIKHDHWCPDEAFDAAVQAVRNWMEGHGIPASKVDRHSDLSPGRKVDPGAGFDWVRFLDEIS